MKQDILINVTPHETRVAVVEDELVQELHIERAENRGITGNIYLGQVVRVLPGIQAAFVDIGLGRTAFLHARELLPKNNEIALPSDNRALNIAAMLTEGQRLLVQVIKDPFGSKGARLTAEVSLPGRTLVFLPESDYVGISRRIPPQRRDPLLANLKTAITEAGASGGYILRTAGEDATREELRREIETLAAKWQQVVQNSKQTRSPERLYQVLPLAVRIVRDLAWPEVARVRIDCGATYDTVQKFIADLVPEALGCIEHYTDKRPIFDLYGVEDDIDNALRHKVALKSGGYLIIDQTEAMTTIDVNTGSYIGHNNLEETIFRTNVEATDVLARQLRLRNIGGIIIIDFIDMAEEQHRTQVMEALTDALERDHRRIHIGGMTSFGLVELTRKRTRESLTQLLTESCPVCTGLGIQKTAQTVCSEIFREILRTSRKSHATRCVVVANPVIIDQLKTYESTTIADLENAIRKNIELKTDSGYRQEQYDVVSY